MQSLGLLAAGKTIQNSKYTELTMKTESKPIGKNGVLHVMTDIERRFSEALNRQASSKVEKTTWPNGYKPTITESEEITVPCDKCDQAGKRYVGTHGPDYEYGPMLYGTCPTCQGTKVKERYRFPREIVKLARKMEGASVLTIARTLVGLQMGMKP